MADVNMNIGNQPLPADVQAYITQLQVQLAAVQAGQNMGQQRVKPSKPTRFNGALCNGYTVFGLNRRTNRCWLDAVGYCHTSTASITMGVSWVKPSVRSMWPERVFNRVS